MTDETKHIKSLERETVEYFHALLPDEHDREYLSDADIEEMWGEYSRSMFASWLIHDGLVRDVALGMVRGWSAARYKTNDLEKERDAAVRERDAARDKNVQLHALVKKYKNKATKQSQKQKKNYKLAKYADESNATLRARLADAEHERDFIVAACRGTRMDEVGLRRLDRMAKKLLAYEAVVTAAVALDSAATVDRLSVEAVQRCYVNLHVALNGMRAAVAAETSERSAPITAGDTQGES